MLTEEIKAALGEFKEAVLSEVQDALAEAAKVPPFMKKKKADGDEEELEEAAVAVEPEGMAELREAMVELQRTNRTAAITAKVASSGLPKSAVTQVTAQLVEALSRRAVDDTEVDASISFARSILLEAGKASPAGLGSFQAGDSAIDQKIKALTGWFQGEMIDGVRPIRNLQESYAGWNGQDYLDVNPFEMFSSFATKYDSSMNHVRVQESLATADWGQVFADVFYLQMIQQYKASPDYDKWRMIVSDIESVPDFRTRHWTRIGGYNDYSTIAEKETYPTLTSPGDEEVQYAVQKYGGIDDISMEMILGDRLGQVRQLPKLMAQAAARTLYKFVFNLATTTNPTMDYDSVALYNSGHANQDTVALSVAGLSGVKVAMRSQTAFGNSQEILGTRCAPKILIVPNELEDRANRIVDPSDAYAAALAATFDTNTELDPHMFKGKGIKVHVYDQLTNAKDWWAVADPSQMATMVVGFLNGRQEPELFTQDQPNVGSTFTADKISYKLRFVFGGDVLDHRAFYYNDVA